MTAVRVYGLKPVITLNFHTIKPPDCNAVIDSATKTRGMVVCEEHSTMGGLASCIDEIVTEKCPVKVLKVGVKSQFGQSGNPKKLLQKYGLTSEDIVTAAHSLI